MPIQTEMLPVLAVCREAEELQRLVDEGNRALILEQVENRYRGLGLLTREQIQRANFPQWLWDDYAI